MSKLKEEIDNLRGNSVVDGGTKDQYDSVLRNKLQELRDEFEVEAENIKLDVENTYKLKVYSGSSCSWLEYLHDI